MVKLTSTFVRLFPLFELSTAFWGLGRLLLASCHHFLEICQITFQTIICVHAHIRNVLKWVHALPIASNGTSEAKSWCNLHYYARTGLKWLSAVPMHGRLDAPRVPYSTVCHFHPVLAICRMTSKEGRQEQMAPWFMRAKVTPIVCCWVRKVRRGPGREQKDTKAGSGWSSGRWAPSILTGQWAPPFPACVCHDLQDPNLLGPWRSFQVVGTHPGPVPFCPELEVGVSRNPV